MLGVLEDQVEARSESLRLYSTGLGSHSGVGEYGRQESGWAMLSFTGGLKVVQPVDLRKSFSGLEGLVKERLGEDVREGALFVFSNRKHTRLKIFYSDGTGLWLLIKRLEKGTFSWPKNVDAEKVKLKLAPEALAMLTDGAGHAATLDRAVQD